MNLSRPVPKRKLPPPCSGLKEVGATVCAVPSSAATAPSDVAVPSSTATSAGRLYELVIHNYTDLHFKLTGPTLPLFRKVPQGRLVHLQPTLCPGETLTTGTEATAIAQALFGASTPSAKEDALEFTLSFMNATSEQGFTVRVHAHDRSPLRSDAIPSGQGLDVTSILQSVPRLLSRPPLGYAETTLGVYRKPERDEAGRVGTLSEGAEVMGGAEAHKGRWMRISSPLEGWIQARTRDGRDLLEAAPGQPNLRQVVSIRPCIPRDIQGADSAIPRPVCKSEDGAAGNWPQASWAEQEPKPWTSELAHFRKSAAFGETARLDKEASIMEVRSLFGVRPRKALVGAIPHQAI